MDSNLKLTLITILVLFIALLVQSTILNAISISGVKPDITLMIIIFIAFRKGCIPGQLSGFFTGIFEDFISLSPLGFHSLIKATIGFLYGLLEGGFIIDAFILPVVFLAAGTVIKGITSWLLVSIFSIHSSGVSILSVKFLIEILYNSLTAPIVFALLKLIKIFKIAEKEKI
jgi:rod shape-determining protein MreD